MERGVQAFDMWIFGGILGISWEDRITNEEVHPEIMFALNLLKGRQHLHLRYVF